MKIILLLLALIITSCSSSLVYSPSLQLDKEQLDEGEVSVTGSVTMLPETRPTSLRDLRDLEESPQKTSLGFDGRIGYGFSESFNLEGRFWIDMDRLSGKRGGLALASAYYLNEDDRLSYFLKPTIGIVIDNGQYEGLGYELPIGLVYDITDSFYNYTSVGIAYGVRDGSVQQNGNREIGVGILGHIGFGYEFNDLACFKAELTPIQQLNFYDDTKYFIISGTLGLSLNF